MTPTKEIRKLKEKIAKLKKENSTMNNLIKNIESIVEMIE